MERTTRFTLLVRLPDNRKAITVRDAVAAKIVELPEHLRRSLTWDQGKERAANVSFTVATNLAVYFCDPHSPWQRGTNENTTNGLLRQYLPRSLDSATVTARQLDAIAAELNERPPETLGWMTPSEKFSELVAMVFAFDLETQAFALAPANVYGVEFAPLDPMQHGLSCDAEGGCGLTESDPAGGGVLGDLGAELIIETIRQGAPVGRVAPGDEPVTDPPVDGVA